MRLYLEIWVRCWRTPMPHRRRLYLRKYVQHQHRYLPRYRSPIHVQQSVNVVVRAISLPADFHRIFMVDMYIKTRWVFFFRRIDVWIWKIPYTKFSTAVAGTKEKPPVSLLVSRIRALGTWSCRAPNAYVYRGVSNLSRTFLNRYAENLRNRLN